MLKSTIAALLIVSPAMAENRYCPVESDPNYGEYIVPIPFGIAHFTEEWPRYCQVHHISGESICMQTPAAEGDEVITGPVIKILIETSTPRIIVADKVYVPCAHK